MFVVAYFFPEMDGLGPRGSTPETERKRIAEEAPLGLRGPRSTTNRDQMIASC